MKISFAEAKQCPECKETGSVVLTRPVSDGSKVVSMRCMNERCPWFETEWIIELDANSEVQVNEKAYKAAMGEAPLYKKPDPTFAEMHKKVHQALGRQLKEETGGA